MNTYVLSDGTITRNFDDWCADFHRIMYSHNQALSKALDVLANDKVRDVYIEALKEMGYVVFEEGCEEWQR